jgi:hypothetical protein
MAGTKADYGSLIAEADAQAKAHAWLESNLKDPDSAKIEWRQFEKGWVRDSAIDDGNGAAMFGYNLYAKINAKNGYGGYTGYKQYHFFFRNGELIATWYEQEFDGIPRSYMGRAG